MQLRRMAACAVSLALIACTGPQKLAAPVALSEGVAQNGQVTSIRDVTTRSAQTSGFGSFIGGLAGSILGTRIGSGNGQSIAMIGGALAGGVTGNELEQASRRSQSTTELTVRLDNGEMRTYQVSPKESFQIGDRVTITPGQRVARAAQ